MHASENGMKAAMRRQIRQALMALSPQAAAKKSRAACKALTTSEEFLQARSVMIYLSTPGEVDTAEIALAAWQSGKTVLAPRVSWEHKHMAPLEIRGFDNGLAVGRNNIREPIAGVPWPLEEIDLVVVGSDRIARNGDSANKIGTYGLAILCKYHNIPFYIAAPTSTVDIGCDTGAHIPIEERKAEEVTHLGGHRVAAAGVDVFNPAFDVVPHALIAGIITEHGVALAPFEPDLVAMVARARAHHAQVEPA